jgi:peroxiredoxin Q/BCP
LRFTALIGGAVAAVVGLGAGFQSIALADDAKTMIAVGATAPAVVGSSTYAGKIEDFNLSKTIANGAIVLYFFPKAFTSG